MKNCLFVVMSAGRLVAVAGFLLWMVSCAGFPGTGNSGSGSEAGVSAPADAAVNAGSGVFTVTYRRQEDVAAFADGSTESAIALMRAAAGEPYPLYVKLREGFETVEPDATDPLRLPFEAVAGSTSPARVVINGGGRTVSLAGAGSVPLLTVGEGVTLTLRNITFTGTDSSAAPLIEVNGKGARLVLGTGAVIRGNTNTNTAGGGQAGGVLVREGVLELAGGKISDNNALSGGSAGGVYVAAAGKFTMLGGEISDNGAGITGEGNLFSGGGVYTAGTFELKDGTLGGNAALGNRGGGAVYVASGGTVTMSGGSISGGSGSFAGGVSSPTIYSGAVYIAGTEAVFTMSGGTIEGYTISNKGLDGRANICGGGVVLWSGTFNMEDGSINGNSVSAVSASASTNGYARAFGGGVYMNRGNFNMKGGTINGNSVSAASAGIANAFGGGIYRAGGTFAQTSGSVSGNTPGNIDQ
jgi:hypothetical protein